ncbi:MAG: hypothetical protein HYT20_02310 [Candidatus Nealsonbacteria bacterium]|nr:hypothetical protein [Candidatus Nealsonbacteria bacterium]
MVPIKKYELSVTLEELKILESAIGDWKIITRHGVPEGAPPPSADERKELLDQGECLHNRIRLLLLRLDNRRRVKHEKIPKK